MKQQNKLMTSKEVAKYLKISESKAYDIIKTLNKELKEKGYYTISGRISKKYLDERLFGEVS